MIAPGKRPYNTLTAVFVMQDGVPLVTTGQHGTCKVTNGVEVCKGNGPQCNGKSPWD